jgi:hypothetical protein
MSNWRDTAEELIEEYNLCCRARPKQNAVDIQLLKDECGKFASQLYYQIAWGNDTEVAEAYYQLVPRLKKLKEQVVIEILQNGTI